MKLSVLLVSVLAFGALCYVPAIPLHHLSETSWIPVWTVYLMLVGNLLQPKDAFPEILVCLFAINIHLGVSLGVGLGLTKIFSRKRKSNNAVQ